MINTKYKKTLIAIVLLIIFSGLMFLFAREYKKQTKQQELNQQSEVTQKEVTQKKEQNQVDKATATLSSLKTYRNEERGFEFQYPEDWVVEENYFRSYYSKFNLNITPINERHTKSPVGINIVLPEFAERSFGGLEKTVSEVIIDEIVGVKHEYEFGGRQEIAIILPLGDLRMIIGTDDKQYYEKIFNQILTSFKFSDKKSDSVKIVP